MDYYIYLGFGLTVGVFVIGATVWIAYKTIIGVFVLVMDYIQFRKLKHTLRKDSYNGKS